ncbi:class I SAM-dependent methyltransferase [Candidatus Chloroploca asiatica]|uniref:class I SAM-dependent methyltransferase n=1 Tax=Candidatus Chloroploca asiatica TaxID=1506545 RepID=UPI001558BE6F|nr:class I SAM-dependent methyltransferase [Candidatus Chloroploca asiatica]
MITLDYLMKRLSGLYSYLENRSLSMYWQARAKQVIEGVQISSRDHVLEIGCGVGLWTSFFTPRSRSFVAIDLDKGFTKYIKSWKAPCGLLHPTHSAHIGVANAEQLPFLRDTFSRIIAIDVIEHVPDDRAMVEEMYRVLAPNSRLVLTTLLADRPSYFQRMNFEDHKREYSQDGLCELVKSVGFDIEKYFYFYFTPTLFAREIQVFIESKAIGRFIGVSLMVGLILRMISSIEKFFCFGRPGGIGVVAVKS